MNKLLQKLGVDKTMQRQTSKDDISKVDDDIMRQLPDILNIKHINGTNSYKGSTYCLDDESCQKLKKAGIKGILSFLREGFPEEMCKKYGFETYIYPTGLLLWKSDMFKNEKKVCDKAEQKWFMSDEKEPFEQTPMMKYAPPPINEREKFE